MLKSVEQQQNDLQTVANDDENEILTKLLEGYHEQLKACDATYIEAISTLRRIQMNVNKYDESCQDIDYTMREQRLLFDQLMDNSRNIVPDHFGQQIQVLKSLQKDVHAKTDAKIDMLKELIRQTQLDNGRIAQFLNHNERLKSEIAVSD